MAGGYLQLVAYGPQDMYLTNNPQITFFKVVYRRHTDFSIETFEYTILDGPNFGARSKITLPRNGDLISTMYLRIVVSEVVPGVGEKFAWVKRLGFALLRYVDIEIGGFTIDRQYGVWLDIW